MLAFNLVSSPRQSRHTHAQRTRTSRVRQHRRSHQATAVFLHSEPLTCRSPSAPPIHFLTPCSHLPRVGPTGRQPHRDTRTVRRLPISETSRLWYTATTEPHVSSVLSLLIRTAILTLRLPIGIIRTDRPAHTPLSSVLPILTVTACSLLERGGSTPVTEGPTPAIRRD